MKYKRLRTRAAVCILFMASDGDSRTNDALIYFACNDLAGST